LDRLKESKDDLLIDLLEGLTEFLDLERELLIWDKEIKQVVS
jgi:hypothetical protein